MPAFRPYRNLRHSLLTDHFISSSLKRRKCRHAPDGTGQTYGANRQYGHHYLHTRTGQEERMRIRRSCVRAVSAHHAAVSRASRQATLPYFFISGGARISIIKRYFDIGISASLLWAMILAEIGVIRAWRQMLIRSARCPLRFHAGCRRRLILLADAQKHHGHTINTTEAFVALLSAVTFPRRRRLIAYSIFARLLVAYKNRYHECDCLMLGYHAMMIELFQYRRLASPLVLKHILSLQLVCYFGTRQIIMMKGC